jgi:adenine-specific DNA-methyltransferase
MPFLDWANKNQALRAARETPEYALSQQAAHGEPSGNLLIQGDNLPVLKALLPAYAGRVKCVFIDPPYNTQGAFAHYGDRLAHDRWLSMMAPRIALLRDMLAEDGSIWVMIDDNEAHYLKVLMDEIFGRSNFVANALWQKRTSPDARLALGAAHDHILVYAKDAGRLTLNRLPLAPEQAARFKNPDGDPLGPWASADFTAQGWRPNQMYVIETPSGARYEPPPGRCWANVESEFLALRQQGRIWFGRDASARPRVKNYLSEHEGVSAWSWWPHAEAGHNQEAKKEINALFGADHAFDTPKPERLIARVLGLATREGDLVLDSFLGSGTTAAVAHKMRRAYVGIEAGGHARTHCLPRLQKVLADGTGGGGFRFCTLSSA